MASSNLDDTTYEEVVRIDAKAAAKVACAIQNYSQVVQDAKEANQIEHDLGILASIRAYPKAVIFSIGISMAIVMEGYDTLLLPNFFAQPAFQRKFGHCDAATNKCQLTAPWQAGLTNGTQIGSLIGLQAVGLLTDRFGYRKTMMGSLFFMSVFLFFPFFAQSLPVLLIGQILQGLPWGVYQSLAVSYAADVCPTGLRTILTTYVNLCWVMGQLVAAGVLRATVNRTDKWAYKIPYALQWMWIPIVLTFVVLAPESPWVLVRQGRLDDAERAIRRLSSQSNSTAASEHAQKAVALLKHTNELEKAVAEQESGGTYAECFKGTDLRRTEIGIMTWLVQVLCGSPLMGYSSYFLIQAGLPTTQAFNMTVGQFAIGAVGTMSSWFTMQWLGRREIYLTGQATMMAILLAVGLIHAAHGTPWAIGGLLLVFTAVYDATVGPACYAIVAEVPSARLRAKSVAISRICYNLAGIVTNVLQPRMLNPTAWNLGAYCAFVWLGTSAVLLVWTFYRLPSLERFTYGELDALFEAKLPARKFKRTRVDPFGSLNGDEKEDKHEEVEPVLADTKTGDEKI